MKNFIITFSIAEKSNPDKCRDSNSRLFLRPRNLKFTENLRMAEGNDRNLPIYYEKYVM